MMSAGDEIPCSKNSFSLLNELRMIKLSSGMLSAVDV